MCCAEDCLLSVIATTKLTGRLTLSLILIEPTHEVSTFAQRTARIVSLISYYCSSSLECLWMVNIMLFGGASAPTYIAQHLNHLFLIKQLEDPCAKIVKVRR
jgi:hypothetical protein